MVKNEIDGQKICSIIGGSYKKRKNDCVVDLDDPVAACNSIGGDYDYDDESCNLPMDDPSTPKRILDRSGLFFFFVLQVIVGSLSVLINTYYAPTTLPMIWWVSYIILVFSFLFSFLMYWYRLGDWKESFIRSSISLAVIALVSVVIGWIYNWDITLYWGFEGFAKEPIAASIAGIIISSLLSVILVPPQERASNNPSNDWDTFL